MLNNKLTLDWAQSFASRVIETAGTDPQKQVQSAYRIAFGRLPTDSEKSLVEHFFAEHAKVIQERVSANEPLALPTELPRGIAEVQAATLVDFCHMLLNSNEFVYLN